MTDIKTRECTHCDGTGEVDAEDYLDLNSTEAVRKELIELVLRTDQYGLIGTRANRMMTAARVAFLASRLSWLESSQLLREEFKAKYERVDLVGQPNVHRTAAPVSED